MRPRGVEVGRPLPQAERVGERELGRFGVGTTGVAGVGLHLRRDAAVTAGGRVAAAKEGGGVDRSTVGPQAQVDCLE